MLPLFRDVVKFFSINRLFIHLDNIVRTWEKHRIAIWLAIVKDCHFLKKSNCQKLFEIFQCYTIGPKKDLRKVMQWKCLDRSDKVIRFIENWDDEKINSKNSKCVSFFLTFGRTKLKRCPNLSGVIRKYRKNIQNCSTCFLFITPWILLNCERVFKT